MIITFCGHSDYTSKLQDEKDLFNLIEKVSQGNKVDFYLGGYGNFDKFALKCAKKYKEKYQNTKIIFITPYVDNWLNSRKDIIYKNYDEIIYPEIENVPKKFAILKRNEWMIKKADYLFAYVNLHFGGAYKTLFYAHTNKKPYTNLYKGNFNIKG